MKNKKTISVKVLGITYAYIHFSVEVSCFYFLCSRMAIESDFWIWALIFDALAFLPQSIIGMITDKNKGFNIGAFGGICCVLALLIPINMVSLFLIGIGNSMVHISGANATLRNSNGKLTSSGIFVGAGSFGVITGQLIARISSKLLFLIPLVFMLVATALIIVVHNNTAHFATVGNFNLCKKYPITVLLGSSVLVVAIRAYIGYAIPISWNKTVWQNILLFVFMGVGKMSGGWLSDLFGVREVGAWSLILSIPFMLFGNRIMILSLIGIMLFSMTMTITLGMIVSAIPDMPGLAFGLTTFGLFLGSFPAFFIRPKSLLFESVTVILFTVVALVMIILFVKRKKDIYD